MVALSIRKAVAGFLCLWSITLLFLLFSTPNLREDPLSCAKKENKHSVAPKPKPDPFPKELSFILLNWNRLQCLKTIVKNAQKYSPFLTEIIVGNNNPDVLLTPEDFDSPLVPLRVFNFPQNQYFFARYELCLMSRAKYCYMQDDDWDNQYVKTLYANFLKAPHLLHTNTNAFVHFLSWSWTFFEPAINLHTGFSWLGTGAIASRAAVESFVLDQIVLIDRKDVPLADMYFATWFNQVPYQLQNSLHELDTSQSGFSNQEGGIMRNKAHITKGIRTLYKQLSARSSLFQKNEAHPTVEERYTKSSCYDDDCLFMTSVHSFPNPRQVIYEIKMDLDEVESRHSNVFNHESFVKNPYNLAVDNDTETAWISLSGKITHFCNSLPLVVLGLTLLSEVQKGDFFGLDLMESLEKEAIYLIVKHDYQDELEVEVSLDGESWSTTCTWESEKKDVSSINHFGGVALYRYIMTSSCTCSFRYVRFKATKQYTSPFHVFDVAFSDKTGAWSQVHTTAKDCNLDFETPTALREIDKDEIPITLVLLNWKRAHNLHEIFEHLSPYKVITEYIIWNNNNEKLLEESTLFPKGVPAGVTVRIINSPQNLHDYAKYLSCSMANNDYCYFQDDDWLNKYFQSQYTSFLRYPESFHSMTIPIIYLEHRRWNIYNAAVDLHAGFSWLGVGSFASKKRVQSFLHQCSLFNLSQDELLQADMFFSYFNNDYPMELSAIPSQLDQTGAWSQSVDQWGIVYKRLSIAATKVYKYLLAGNKGDLIPPGPPVPSYENRDYRAPCRMDECLFITNSYPFPHPSEVTFDASETIKEQESIYNSLDWPSNWFWTYNSYERAVDHDPFTCWTSYQNAKKGDYFGLDLLKTNNYPIFTITLDHDILQYDVFVSTNANIWSKVQYTVDKSWPIAGPLVIYTISLNKIVPFRFIKLSKTKHDDKLVLSLYEFYLGSLAVNTHFFTASKVENPSFEDSTFHWNIQGPTSDIQRERGNIGHTGSSSLVFGSDAGDADFMATQVIELGQTSPKMIVVSAYSRCEKAVNMNYPNAGYAVSLDATYADGQTDWAVQTYVFNTGDHDWQPRVFAFKPVRNLKSVTVILSFNKFRGTAWFDDITVQEDL